MDTTRLLVVTLVVAAALGSPGVGAAAAAEDCSFPVTRTDATGTAVTISEDPDEIVTLNPSAAQTMYEIDAWDEVVGVSTYADYLPGVDEKTTVGTGRSDATVERTVALDPDLVLAPNTIDDGTVSQLRGAGLTVYKFEAAGDLDDVVEKTRLFGALVGACGTADDRADEMERQLDVVEGAVADEEKPTVFYTFFGYTAGEDTFIHEVIETAGGDNVAADDVGINANGASTSGYFLANAEVVVEADPAWFVLNSDQYDTATVPSGPNGVYEDTTAYQQGNAVVLDADEISQPAPRLVDAIVDLVRVLHPEAYESEIEGRIEGDTLDGERRVTSERLADGSVRLQAENVGRTDEVGFDVPPRPNATADVRRLNVTLDTVNPTFELRLRYGGTDAAPNGTRALETVTVSGNGIYASDVHHLTLRLAVNRSRLDGADPETVTLYRRNDTGWVPLQTTRVDGMAGNASAASAPGGNASADVVVYEARTPTLSTLTLAVADPRPESASETNATPVSTVTVTATATPDPETATVTATPDPETATAADDTATGPTTTPGSAPGFGPLVALVALSTLALAGRWRR